MSKSVLTNLDFNNQARAVGLLDPVAAQDAATKAYVDNAIEGLAWKDSARVATQANVNLASPGASVDGVTMAIGDRVLVAAQTTASENGIYVWNGAAVAMTRAVDASTFPELEQAITTVEEGTSAGVSYRQTAVNGTLGSTSVAWTVFGQASAAASTGTAGVIALATQSEVDAGAVTNKAVVPSTLAASVWAKKKFSANYGDGSQTQYTITHNLGTRDVQVVVYRNSTPWDEVLVDVERDTVNTVVIRHAGAPALNSYRVVVIG
jgi:hypothetical protein